MWLIVLLSGIYLRNDNLYVRDVEYEGLQKPVFLRMKFVKELQLQCRRNKKTFLTINQVPSTTGSTESMEHNNDTRVFISAA